MVHDVELNELFESAGLRIVEGGRWGRGADCEPPVNGIRALAEAVGGDQELAVHNAAIYQWLVRAVPSFR
jgi:hypothetical protein